MKSEVDARLGEDSQRVEIPIDISEESGISGFSFLASRPPVEIESALLSPSLAAGTKPIRLAKLSTDEVARLTAGAPAIDANSVTIWMGGKPPSSIPEPVFGDRPGSSADYIWMRFASGKRVKLWGLEREHFPSGSTLTWDLNDVRAYLESLPTDDWDDITLTTDSNDGLFLRRIRIMHSGVTILDWECNQWLDGSKETGNSKLGLAAPMLSQKLSTTGDTWVPQIHWASRELGKTDGRKYSGNYLNPRPWCSEFASWCLRKALWNTPKGNINVRHMERYFEKNERKVAQAELLAGQYVLKEGDYLRLEFYEGHGGHSGMFIRYLDSPDNPTENTRLLTIEGNHGGKVDVARRTFRDIVSAGNTR